MSRIDSAVQAEITRLFAVQDASHRIMRNSSAAERIAKLERFKHAIEAHADAVCAAIFADLGRPAAMALSAEVRTTVSEIDEAITQLDAWMASTPVTMSLPIPNATAHIRYEARGRVLVLGPWNFPVSLVLSPIVAAIAAGNTVIAKPNELAPHCSAVTAAILRDAFDEADVAVIEGGVDCAQALLELPFDHIFFTGSPNVGRVVMTAAAQHLASVTLELGGKCPVIIGDGVDLASVALKVVGGRCSNNGQLCLAPDHVWIKADLRDAFLGHLRDAIAMMFCKDGVFDPATTGKIIDDRNFARVSGYIDDALARGAKLVCGGGRDAAARTIEPTVLADVPTDARVMQDEIFGPVLPVLAYQELEEVFAYHRQRGKPLATYAFSSDTGFIEAVLAAIPSGGVTINGVIMHAAEMRLPFGGVNESGIGRYHGVHGFRELSHERAVLTLAG